MLRNKGLELAVAIRIITDRFVNPEVVPAKQRSIFGGGKLSIELKDVASLSTVTNALVFLKGSSHYGKVLPWLDN